MIKLVKIEISNHRLRGQIITIFIDHPSLLMPAKIGKAFLDDKLKNMSPKHEQYSELKKAQNYINSVIDYPGTFTKHF